MKLVGSQIIPASRAEVWDGLNDPVVLKQCIVGCDSFTKESANRMKARVSIKVGWVKFSVTGVVTLSNIHPPESCHIVARGQGGLAGFASGGAHVRLTIISATETLVDYEVVAQAGGKMATLGAKFVSSTAQSLAQKFFDRFAAAIKIKYEVSNPWPLDLS